MTEAKPIAVFYIEESLQLPDGNRLVSEINKIKEGLEKQLTDYHVFVFPKTDLESPYQIEVKTFLEKDLTEIQYSELQKMITEQIDKLTTTNK